MKLIVAAMTIIVGLGLAACTGTTEPEKPAAVSSDQFLGRWDVTIQGQDGPYPSWFGLEQEGGQLTGRFVGRVGSARPIQTLSVENGTLSFSLPIQYESHSTDMKFEGSLVRGTLEGTTNAEDGSELHWRAVQAPTLERTAEPQWGESISLVSGNLDDHWKLRSPGEQQTWKLSSDGVLDNTAKGSDLVTTKDFTDFKVHVEFKYPENSNSGLYLRGRYEVQIEDGYGKDPHSRSIGSIYGFLTPTKDAAKPAGEWQSYDITLIGRRVTIVLNGETVVDDQEIPGITGGALNSNEGEPGPLMIQGDHGPITFRNIGITPAR
jgi:hypothetical protein